MNDIDADTLFRSLYNGGYTKTLLQRNTNCTTQYSVVFHCEKCRLNASHHFDIHVENGKHLADALAVKRFYKKHNSQYR